MKTKKKNWIVSINRNEFDSRLNAIKVLDGDEEQLRHPQGPLVIADINNGLGSESEANARLIAAAPDLLCQLSGLIDQIEALGIEEWHGAEGLDLSLARAAVQKATGEGQ